MCNIIGLEKRNTKRRNPIIQGMIKPTSKGLFFPPKYDLTQDLENINLGNYTGIYFGKNDKNTTI